MNRLKLVDVFDVDTLKDDFRATLIAPSNAGKTEYLLYLLSEIVSVYRYIFLIVPTINDKYARYIWPNHMFLVETVQQINEVIETIMKFASNQTKLGHKKKILVITDDLGSMTADKSCKIDRLLYRGRGIGISVLILAQSYQMISPNMRNNITHTFLFSITDDFMHYLKNIPKTEPMNELMPRIRNLVLKLSTKSEPEDIEEGRKTRYIVAIVAKEGGRIELQYSFIKKYGELYKRNILGKQASRMLYQNIDDIDNNDKVMV